MLITIFLISMFAMLFLLGMKMYEVAHTKSVVTSRVMSRFDGSVQENVTKLNDATDERINRAKTFIMHEVPKHSLETFYHVKNKSKERYRSMVLNTRGVRVLRNKRDASKFLQNISQERERDGKGWIEDGHISDKPE